MFSGYNVSSQILVSDSSICLGIENLSTFERRVYSSDMKLNGNASHLGGEGGFNIVYQGTLPNRSWITIKRLKYTTKIKGGAYLSHILCVNNNIKH